MSAQDEARLALACLDLTSLNDGDGAAAIDAQREYRLAINNFTAGGGDGYPKLSDHPGHLNTGFTDADVMRAFIAARSPIKAADFAPPPDVVRR